MNVTVEKSTIYAALRRVGERERTRIQTDEVYLPGIGLSKPKRTDLGSDQKKAIREEMLAKRARGYPKPKKKA